MQALTNLRNLYLLHQNVKSDQEPNNSKKKSARQQNVYF